MAISNGGKALDIRLVEVEIYNFCNRTCSFCPNSFIDRRSEFIELPESIFLKLLDNLSDRGYDRFCRLVDTTNLLLIESS